MNVKGNPPPFIWKWRFEWDLPSYSHAFELVVWSWWYCLVGEDLEIWPCWRTCVTGGWLWSVNAFCHPRAWSLWLVVWDVSSQLLQSPCLHAAMPPHHDDGGLSSLRNPKPQINPSVYKLPWPHIIAVGRWLIQQEFSALTLATFGSDTSLSLPIVLFCETEAYYVAQASLEVKAIPGPQAFWE